VQVVRSTQHLALQEQLCMGHHASVAITFHKQLSILAQLEAPFQEQLVL
jgi:hypothetical protein